MAAEPDDDGLRQTVSAARSGDKGAVARLIAEHLAPLEAFVRVRAGAVVLERESVADLVQSVCREALADLSQIEYRGARSFRNWLFLLATRKILDRKKHHLRAARDIRRERASVDSGEAALLAAYATIASPSRVAAARDEIARIETALATLPEAQQDAVAYVKLLELPYAEVAARMAITESAVRNLVARGLSNLVDRLRQREG